MIARYYYFHLDLGGGSEVAGVAKVVSWLPRPDLAFDEIMKANPGLWVMTELRRVS